jgi:lipid-A-disaccharide synthase
MQNDIAEFKPDVIILLTILALIRIAKWAKEKSIPTHYYISPQIWAWKENRITDIKKDVDKMYVILPFEKHFMKTKFFGLGHP